MFKTYPKTLVLIGLLTSTSLLGQTTSTTPSTGTATGSTPSEHDSSRGKSTKALDKEKSDSASSSTSEGTASSATDSQANQGNMECKPNAQGQTANDPKCTNQGTMYQDKTHKKPHK
jgi:hypothetical protein